MNMKRRRWLFIVPLVILTGYGALYLYLRSCHYFIHRAGEYADPRDNHYIEVGKVADGPQVFGAVMLNRAAENGNGPNLDVRMEQATEALQKEEKFRRRLFAVFLPLAWLETLYWKITDPHPLHRAG